jgi:hypothetical protein
MQEIASSLCVKFAEKGKNDKSVNGKIVSLIIFKRRNFPMKKRMCRWHDLTHTTLKNDLPRRLKNSNEKVGLVSFFNLVRSNFDFFEGKLEFKFLSIDSLKSNTILVQNIETNWSKFFMIIVVRCEIQISAKSSFENFKKKMAEFLRRILVKKNEKRAIKKSLNEHKKYY